LGLKIEKRASFIFKFGAGVGEEEVRFKGFVMKRHQGSALKFAELHK
jgi:hypothetical protein